MLEEGFLGYINDNQLFGPTDQVLLAVSGGIDSMAMAELFYQIKQPFAMAHVNFNLRGKESDADADFVKNKADEYEVPFHLIHFDTARIAADRGISIQMAARDLRYEWFAKLLEEHTYCCVATAHHKNDVLETLLLNITRGTGLAGLHGIAARQERPSSYVLIRPLLFATRDEIAGYVQERSVLYREDRSNADDKYARNRIRHHVVPVLTDLNPGLWQTLPRSVERFRAAEVLVQAELERSWNEVAEQKKDKWFLPTVKLLEQRELFFRLSEWLKPFGFTYDQVGQVLVSLSSKVGQVFDSATYRITHDRFPDRQIGLVLEPIPLHHSYETVLTDWPATDVSLPGDGNLSFSLFTKPTDFRFPTDPNVACLDADQLRFPLLIRPWQQGDRFRPLGLSGQKLVSDLLNDRKVSRTDREKVAVLVADGNIVWVIGHRIGHPFRVTEKTVRIVQIICSNK